MLNPKKNEDIMAAFMRLMHMYKQAAHEMVEAHGISPGQPPVLRYLSEHDGCIQRDIAQSCHLKAATISSILDNMEQSGYIERRAQEGDRRVQRVFLTALGREKFSLVHSAFAKLQQSCLEAVEDDEIEVFRRVLEKITSNIKEIGPCKEICDSKGESPDA